MNIRARAKGLEFPIVIAKGRRDGSRNHLEPGVLRTKDGDDAPGPWTGEQNFGQFRGHSICKRAFITRRPPSPHSPPHRVHLVNTDDLWCFHQGTGPSMPPPPSLMALAELVHVSLELAWLCPVGLRNPGRLGSLVADDKH